MKYEHLLLEKKDKIATITLNQPEKLNAFSIKMRESLGLAVGEIAKDDDVRAVIVTGAGRAFSSGVDLTTTRAEPSRYESLEVTGPNFRVDLIFQLDKPVIAAVNGVCAGMGFSLALSCDIRIASEAARFSAIFIRRGLIPDCGATYLLPKIVGISKALELMFTGEIIDAAEAKQLGIVSRVVPPDKLMETAQELAAKIAQQPPVAIELTKRVVHRSMIDDLYHHYDWETYAQQVCRNTEDRAEAIRAFLEKREPAPFQGR